jgi:hypothetical protein
VRCAVCGVRCAVVHLPASAGSLAGAPVLVSATVRGGVLPARLGHGTTLPHNARGPLREHHRTEVTLLGELGRVVTASVEGHSVRAASLAARVKHGGTPWCAPGIEVEDVFETACLGTLVQGAVDGVIDGRLDGVQGAVIPLGDSSALPITRLATDGATL